MINFNLLLEQIVRKYMYVCNIAIQLISSSLPFPRSNHTLEFKSFLIYYNYQIKKKIEKKIIEKITNYSFFKKSIIFQRGPREVSEIFKFPMLRDSKPTSKRTSLFSISPSSLDTQTVSNAKHKRRQITEGREIKFRSNNSQIPQLYRIFSHSTPLNTTQLSLSLSLSVRVCPKPKFLTFGANKSIRNPRFSSLFLDAQAKIIWWF